MVDRAGRARKDYIALAQTAAQSLGEGRDASVDMAAFIRSFDAFEQVQDELGTAIRAEIAVRNRSADRNNMLAFLIDGVAILLLALVIGHSAFTVRWRDTGPLGE